jgi:hypothetical protein
MAMETISRCIRRMQEEKIISVERKQIHILNMRRLCEFADMSEQPFQCVEKGG